MNKIYDVVKINYWIKLLFFLSVGWVDILYLKAYVYNMYIFSSIWLVRFNFAKIKNEQHIGTGTVPYNTLQYKYGAFTGTGTMR